MLNLNRVISELLANKTVKIMTVF